MERVNSYNPGARTGPHPQGCGVNVWTRTISTDLEWHIRRQQTVVTDLWEFLGAVSIGCIQLQDPVLDASLGNLRNVRLVLPFGSELVNVFHSNLDVIAGQQNHMRLSIKLQEKCTSM